MGAKAALQLIQPTLEALPAYAAALSRGWSPDNIRGEVAAREQLAKIDADATAFVAQQSDRDAKGPPIKLPDGSTAARIPGYQMWMWDGEFCGSIGFRWQPGTSALPPHVLGHIGYAVVPWKRRRGFATAALGMILPRARAEGLAFVEITTDADNPASQRVILANGGVLIGPYTKPPQYGGADNGLKYRIDLTVR
ncbi:MAG: GNAT family N-acetyltransferase [Casimicrobiaceae bacterium]